MDSGLAYYAAGRASIPATSKIILMVLGLHLSHQIGLKLVASALGDLSGRQEADQAKNRPFQESVHPADQASSGSTYNPALPGWPYSFLFTKVIFFLCLFSHMKVTETNGGKVINENSW